MMSPGDRVVLKADSKFTGKVEKVERSGRVRVTGDGWTGTLEAADLSVVTPADKAWPPAGLETK